MAHGGASWPPALELNQRIVKMRSPIVGLRVASILFGLVCLAHVVRLWERWEVRIGPFWFGHITSLVAVVVSALLSVWLWSLSKRRAAAPPS